MKTTRTILTVAAMWLLAISCSIPLGGGEPTATPTPTGEAGTPTVTLTPPGSVTATTTFTPTSTTGAPPPAACTPTVVANTNANVRSGPGTVYGITGTLMSGANATVTGKNADGSWWFISAPGANGWISGSVVTATCIPPALAVIAAPPTPPPAAGTCKEGYVYRQAGPSDNVCVPPASQAQAVADNAANASRKLVNVYGPDACAMGYVWREAYSGDKVCVTPETRARRRLTMPPWIPLGSLAPTGRTPASPGTYGAKRLRETMSASRVRCVPRPRRQRRSFITYSCCHLGSGHLHRGLRMARGFFWDRVCVTPAVKAQAAADNAAAPSRTW